MGVIITTTLTGPPPYARERSMSPRGPHGPPKVSLIRGNGGAPALLVETEIDGSATFRKAKIELTGRTLLHLFEELCACEGLQKHIKEDVLPRILKAPRAPLKSD